MPYFLTCEECDKDYLCHDDFRPEPDIEYQTVCPRCFDLYSSEQKKKNKNARLCTIEQQNEEKQRTRGLQMRPNRRIRRQL